VSRPEFDSRAEDLPRAIFNSTRFEQYILAPFTYNNAGSGYNLSGLPTTFQTSFDPGTDLLRSVSSADLLEWVNSTVFQIWAESYLQSAFVEAINSGVRDWENRQHDNIELLPSVILQRLIVNSNYAAAAEAMLGLLVVFTFAIRKPSSTYKSLVPGLGASDLSLLFRLIYAYLNNLRYLMLMFRAVLLNRKRQSLLQFDPASLASTVDLVSRSNSIKELYHGQGISCTPFKTHSRFQLKYTAGEGSTLDVYRGSGYPVVDSVVPGKSSKIVGFLELYTYPLARLGEPTQKALYS
jgi:hypothetical protein